MSGSSQSHKSDTAAPLINANPDLQSYYHSLESRLGYRLLLGGTRHFGYWEHDTYWPFPLSAGLRRMEDKLAEALALPPGSRVLDAGCGVGHVALRMAQKHGLRVDAIDIVEHHVAKARFNAEGSGLLASGTIRVNRMDYHHLETIDTESLDGIYTMETFVHATDPRAVLAGFYRVLRPGGHLAQFEYDNEAVPSDNRGGGAPSDVVDAMAQVNRYAAMPTNAASHPGVFAQMLRDAGFEDVVVRDYSQHIRPLTRLFFLLAVVPYFFVRLLGLERYFINTVAGFGSYRGRDHWRYVAISAKKPGSPIEAPKSK
ncbi:S-adenosyl-L-methionine-dependent methyltransferase [Hypoxylon sp. FL1284]|nr:S-adenosyl-L-methionine-dependent methyltransferase [Hypoxylon sp. FL1284]